MFTDILSLISTLVLQLETHLSRCLRPRTTSGQGYCQGNQEA